MSNYEQEDAYFSCIEDAAYAGLRARAAYNEAVYVWSAVRKAEIEYQHACSEVETLSALHAAAKRTSKQDLKTELQANMSRLSYQQWKLNKERSKQTEALDKAITAYEKRIDAERKLYIMETQGMCTFSNESLHMSVYV